MNWIKLIVWEKERERERDFQLIHTGWFHLQAFHGKKQERGHKEKQRQTPHMLTIILMQRRRSHGYKFCPWGKPRERERELGICFQDQCVLRLLELHVGFTCYGSSAAAVELSNNDGRSRTKHEWTSAQHRPLAPFCCALFSPTPSKRLVVRFPSSIINATLMAKCMDCGDIVDKWATQVKELSQFQIITGSRGVFRVFKLHTWILGWLQNNVHPPLFSVFFFTNLPQLFVFYST